MIKWLSCNSLLIATQQGAVVYALEAKTDLDRIFFPAVAAALNRFPEASRLALKSAADWALL